jgi:hypothetical protein
MVRGMPKLKNVN